MGDIEAPYGQVLRDPLSMCLLCLVDNVPRGRQAINNMCTVTLSVATLSGLGRKKNNDNNMQTQI